MIMDLIEGIHYTICDNFLSEEEHKFIHDFMLYSERFSWYYIEDITGVSVGDEQVDALDDYYFYHLFYNKNSVSSSNFNILDSLLRKINPFSLFRIKANLYPRTETIIKHKYHVDFNIKQKTGIYYINTNNGKTIFKDGLVVDSVANRYVEFDTDLLHASTTCTDSKVRCNINLNYMLIKT